VEIVAIQGIDHLYVETRSFEQGVAFWQGLGFELEAQWGSDGHRAGRLKAGDAEIVLAESDSPIVTVHFRVDDAAKASEQVSTSSAVKVQRPLEQTHWGTRWLRVSDAEGHVYALEEGSPR
jgi:hypothetical protein